MKNEAVRGEGSRIRGKQGKQSKEKCERGRGIAYRIKLCDPPSSRAIVFFTALILDSSAELLSVITLSHPFWALNSQYWGQSLSNYQLGIRFGHQQLYLA